MPKLKLNDGTEIDGAYALENGGTLTAYLPGMTLADGFGMLNDTEKTKKIQAEQYGQKITFSGFKHLFSLREEPGGLLSAGFRKK